jgi:hypothetical protein
LVSIIPISLVGATGEKAEKLAGLERKVLDAAAAD